LFIYAKASVVPVCMMLKMLDFGGEWFVAKLTNAWVDITSRVIGA
jgi:hypothetical protein